MIALSVRESAGGKIEMSGGSSVAPVAGDVALSTSASLSQSPSTGRLSARFAWLLARLLTLTPSTRCPLLLAQAPSTAAAVVLLLAALYIRVVAKVTPTW